MRICVVLVAAMWVALALPSVAAARPDLQVRAVSTPSFQEAPGSRLTGSATVRNAGDRIAPPTRLGFYLSRDRRKGRGDFRLRPRPRVRARRPRTRQRLLRTLTVPRGVPAGSYALIACADDTRRVRERRERNNCRSARRRLRIIAPASPTPGPPPPTTTVSPSPVLVVRGPPNGSATSDNTPTYTGAARSFIATIARIEARVDAGGFSTSGVTCTGCGAAAAAFAFTPTAPLADGPHVFSFRAVDAAGRFSPIIARSVTVDTTAPTFNSISATPGSNSVTATFSEPLACGMVNPFDFTAEINNVPVTVTQAACSPTSPTITLTLASAPAAGAIVEITLSGIVNDPAGNVAAPATRSDPA